VNSRTSSTIVAQGDTVFQTVGKWLSAQLCELLLLVFCIVVAEDFSICVHYELPAILMALPLRDQFFIHSRFPQAENQTLADVTLRKVGVAEALARSFERLLGIMDVKHRSVTRQ
jgi:hypothetical protein